MGRETFTREAFREVEREVKTKGRGTASFAGEQRQREGKGLDPLVDPKEYGMVRRSLTRTEKGDSGFVATMPLAMLNEVRFDTTSSMGDNVDLAFGSLPKLYDLLTTGERPVLARYDTQIITGVFNDWEENPVFTRSQAEMGKKIAEQMTLHMPVRRGGDTPEDGHYGIFAGAFLTYSHAQEFGLKSYDFTVTDAPGRHAIEEAVLRKIFGDLDELFGKIRENGHQVTKSDKLSTADAVEQLLKRAHGFVLQVGSAGETNRFWNGIYGRERVVVLPDASLLSEAQAAIIGLTEGVLNLQTLGDYLKKVAQLSSGEAEIIRRAVAGIPIGLQMKQKNFSRVFKAGAKFKKKGDVFPIGFDEESSGKPASPGKPGKVKWV